MRVRGMINSLIQKLRIWEQFYLVMYRKVSEEGMTASIKSGVFSGDSNGTDDCRFLPRRQTSRCPT